MADADKIQELAAEVERLEGEVERYKKRDLNASIQLVYETDIDPFAREDLKVIDVSVSDNIYCVESEVLNKALKQSGIQWIPVSPETMPEEDKEILLVSMGKIYLGAIHRYPFIGLHFQFDGQNQRVANVTLWAEITPPEGGK